MRGSFCHHYRESSKIPGITHFKITVKKVESKNRSISSLLFPILSFATISIRIVTMKSSHDQIVINLIRKIIGNENLK